MGYFNKDEKTEASGQLKKELIDIASSEELFNAQVIIMQAIIAHPDYQFEKKDLKEYEIPNQSVSAIGITYREGYRYELVAKEALKYIKAIL